MYIYIGSGNISPINLKYVLVDEVENYKPVLSATNALIALNEGKITLREAIEDCAFVDFSSCLTEYDYMRALYLAKAKETLKGSSTLEGIDAKYLTKDFLMAVGFIYSLEQIPKDLWLDKDIVRLAVNSYIMNFTLVPRELLQDKQYIIDIFNNFKPTLTTRWDLWTGDILEHFPREILDDIDFVHASIKLIPEIFSVTNNKIKFDKEYIIKNLDGLVSYDCLSPEMLDDLDVAKAMLDKCVDRHWELIEVFERISPRLRQELLSTFIDESQRICGESHDNFFDHNDSEEFIAKVVEYIPDAFNDAELVLSYITQPVFSSILMMGQSKITRYIRRNGKFIFNNNIYKIIEIIKDKFVDTIEKEEDIHAYVLSRLTTEEEVEVEEITF